MEKLQLSVERLDYKPWAPFFQQELTKVFSSIQQRGPGCLIIGQGPIGAKVQNLIDHAGDILLAGFSIKPMVVLTEECFEQMKFLSGLSDGFLKITPYKDRYLTKIDPTLRMFLDQIHTYFGGEDFLIVRSSAVGDAAGTGIWESHRGNNTVLALTNNLQRVVQSDLTEEAELFRKDTKLDSGIAACITPIVGNRYNSIFAPCISGYAFTNQFQKGLHLNIGPGIGGGISSTNKLCLSEAEVKQFDTITAYRDYYILHDQDVETRRRAPELYLFTDIADKLNCCRDHNYHKNDFYGKSQAADEEILYGQATEERLFPLIEKIKALKQQIGSDLYVEFALQKKGDESYRYINQIDTTIPTKHQIETVAEEKIIAHTNSILNSGKRKVDTWVMITGGGGFQSLYEFNRTHKNYGIIVPDSALSSGKPPSYSCFSNASVILMTVGTNCSFPPLAHFGGTQKMSGKLFGVIMGSFYRIGYQPRRVLQSKFLKRNDKRYDAVHALPGEREKRGDPAAYTEIQILHTPMTFECDESRDYGVLYIP